ncbi:MAG: hypothetical protein EOO74_02475 [Myxococcales bacterium]|nr:MAG: hypothetical protein EOO74_02475 [Myxococcales bacterium]
MGRVRARLVDLAVGSNVALWHPALPRHVPRRRRGRALARCPHLLHRLLPEPHHGALRKRFRPRCAVRLTAVVACDLNRGIGYQGGLPWPKLPRDLARFRTVTMGKPVIVGRRTWLSIGKPLLGRQLIVVSSTLEAPLPTGVHLARTIEQAIDLASEWGQEAVLAGGADIYRDRIDHDCERVWMTVVHGEYPIDTWLPMPHPGLEISDLPGWLPWKGWRTVIREDHEADDANPVAMTFLDLVPR